MENEQLKDYFTRYPHNDEVYENNGVLFHNRGAADSYGNAKETVRYTRAKVMESPLNPPQGDLKKESEELLKVTDLETAEYKVLKQLAKDLELTTSDQKAETLKAALVEYKTTLTVE